MLPAIYSFVVSAVGGPAAITLPLQSTVGTIVPSGSTVTHDLSGQTWTLSASVTIPALGSVNGVFTADGPVEVAALDTWTILSPVANWDSVGPNVSPVSFDWTVFFAGQDFDDRRAPVPSKPFVAIRFLDLPTDEGRQWAQAFDTSATTIGVVVRNIGLIRTEIQIFSDTDERVIAERLRKSLDVLYPGLDQLSIAGLVPVPSETRMRDLSQIFSGEREFRYVLEVGLRVETRYVIDDYPTIETVSPVPVGIT